MGEDRPLSVRSRPSRVTGGGTAVTVRYRAGAGGERQLCPSRGRRSGKAPQRSHQVSRRPVPWSQRRAVLSVSDPEGRRARRGWAGEPAAAHRWVKWRVAAEVEPIRHPGSRSAPRELRICEPARCTGGHRVALRFSRRACASGLVVHPGSGAARARVVLPRCLGVHREAGVHQQGWSHSQSPGHACRRRDACDRAFAWLSGDTMKTQRPGRLYTSPGGSGGGERGRNRER